MMEFVQIYDLKNDARRIKAVQEASLDKKSQFGYKIENGLLFGTKEWFDAINRGVIIKYFVKGVISRVYVSGHNDFPEFEISDGSGVSTWGIEGPDSYYKLGVPIELTYVNQKFKRPTDITGAVSKCVVEIKVAVTGL